MTSHGEPASQHSASMLPRDNERLGESLIFLVSQPRAGSTLLQRIIAGHPRVQTSAEPWLMLHPAYALKAAGHEAEYGASLAHAALVDFLEFNGGGEAVYLDALRGLASTLYGAALRKGGKEIFLDKTPRYYFIIPELYRLFPKAKFVFLLRNPLAVLHSILETWIRGEWLGLCHSRHDLLTAPRRLIEGVQLLGKDAITVRYEDLVSQPEVCVSQLCGRLGIDFSPDLLSYGERPAPQGRMGDTSGVRRHGRPSVDGLQKWVGLASHDQTRHFAHSYLRTLGPELLGEMGYDFGALQDALGPEREATGAGIVPWEIALRTQTEWSLRDRMVAEIALSVQAKGWLLGTLELARRTGIRLVRSLVHPAAARRG